MHNKDCDSVHTYMNQQANLDNYIKLSATSDENPSNSNQQNQDENDLDDSALNQASEVEDCNDNANRD